MLKELFHLVCVCVCWLRVISECEETTMLQIIILATLLYEKI